MKTAEQPSKKWVTIYSRKSCCRIRLEQLNDSRGIRSLWRQLDFPADFEFPFHLEPELKAARSGKWMAYEKKYRGNSYYLIYEIDQVIGYVQPEDLEDLCCGHYQYQVKSVLTIGPSADHDIVLPDTGLAAGQQVQITLKNGTILISQLRPSLEIYVNRKRLAQPEIHFLDEIFISGTTLIFTQQGLYVANAEKVNLPRQNQFLFKTASPHRRPDYFVVRPRMYKPLKEDAVQIDGPPNEAQEDETPLLLQYGPSVTMSMVMLSSVSVSLVTAMTNGNVVVMMTSSMMAICMLAGTLLWPALLRNYQKKQREKQNAHRDQRYRAYIQDIDRRLGEKAAYSEFMQNNILSPSPEHLSQMFQSETKKVHIWERSQSDPDFLWIRLGSGSQPFEVKLNIPRVGFTLYDDPLVQLPGQLAQKYEKLSHVPITLDFLTHKTIGLTGSLAGMVNMVHEIVLNIIALHPANEVKLVFVLSPAMAREMSIYKSIPHVFSPDHKTRYFAVTLDEIHYAFNDIDEDLKNRETAAGQRSHYVLITDNTKDLQTEPLYRFISDSDNPYITSVFMYGAITRLPKFCRTFIQTETNVTGYFSKAQHENEFIKFDIDPLNRREIEQFARQLSALELKPDVNEMSIAERVSFLNMLHAANVKDLHAREHWLNNESNKSLAAPIGLSKGNLPFELDIHEAYHGCHGLVAGTTGSGKSEFLQSFILSLAVHYSPYEIAFVLVDFKGGDMARPFMAKPSSPALPHLAATISNLSGNTLYRALISLQAEIQYRQRLFNESAAILGVDKLDINSYHRYFKQNRLQVPLPHLVIVVDEFAQLKTQQPDFLTELINVAQVGRSLGIHLILATQKPSGIVDPQIASNSRFRVCLKVADKQDSVEMIGRPDSAYIKNPGRLNLQIGYDEIYETIQAGYSGADYIPKDQFFDDEEVTVDYINSAGQSIHSAKISSAGKKTGRTELEEITASLVELGIEMNRRVKPLWLDELPTQIQLSELPKAARGYATVTLGRMDLIRQQKQTELHMDLARVGHIAVYGMAQTGKTTFLHSVIDSLVEEYQYSDQEVQFYILDAGGRNFDPVRGLPHVKQLLYLDDEEQIQEFPQQLKEILDERKWLFSNARVQSFIQYREKTRQELPLIVVMIDNYSAFREHFFNTSEEMVEIVAAGKTYGFSFLVTGATKNAIHYKVVDHMNKVFTMKLSDPASYLDVLNRRTPIQPDEIPGRGITVYEQNVVEYQIAAGDLQRLEEKYSTAGEDAEPSSAKVQEETHSPEPSPVQTRGRRSAQRLQPIPDDENHLIAGFSKSGAVSFGLDLQQDSKLVLAGSSPEHLDQMMKKLLNQVLRFEERDVFFLEGTTDSSYASQPGVIHAWNEATLDEAIEKLKPLLNAKLDEKNGRYRPLFLIIRDLNDLFEQIRDDQADFLRKICQVFRNDFRKTYFITGFDVNNKNLMDILFNELLVNASNYLIAPNTAAQAARKLEKCRAEGSEACLLMKEQMTVVQWP